MRGMRKERRKRRSYKRLIILTVILLAVFSVVAAAKYIVAHDQVSPGQSGMFAVKNKMNVMIMGVDRRADDVGRSDTLMVATIDQAADKASLLSVPRDTRVKIDGYGFDKINAAYAYGGHKLTKSTVENLLGTEMKYYVLIDIHTFERLIDLIGGIDIDVEKRMYYEDPWDDDGGLVIDFQPGEQHMDGKKAINYVRYRDGEGDIGRIGRQQKFMKAVLAKLITPSIIMKLPEIVKEVNSSVETDMPISEMLALAKELPAIKNNGIDTDMVEGTPAYLQDISYWLPNVKDLRKLMASKLGLDFDDKMQADADTLAAELTQAIPKDAKVLTDEKKSESPKDKKAAAKSRSDITVLVINSSGINGAGAKLADTLMQQGFKISSVETGRSSSMQHTAITAAQNETSMFYGMPFPCTIMSGGDNGQAVIIIGKDYQK